MNHVRYQLALPLLAAAAVLAGCNKPPTPLVKSTAPDVIVELPTLKDVTDYEDFTGRTEAFKEVYIRPEVTGKLIAVHFKDGDFVTFGAPLFDIDDDLYKAQRDSAKANVELAQARVNLSKQLLATAEKGRDSSTIAMDEYVKAEAEHKANEASVRVAKARLTEAQTTLDYTKIAAPYTGRISRRMVDPGNIIKANETLLTRIVVLDPIYVSFDIDERTVLTFRKMIQAGKIASARDARLDVLVGLADEDGYSRTATLTFADNQFDVNTGTLRFRAELRNPSLQFGPLPALMGAAAAIGADQKGLKLLSPGMFVRVRLPVGKEHAGLLIPEEALGSDQGHRFVYVVNDKDEAVYRRVKLGPQDGRMRVIDEGIAPGERVIVSGLQRVRPNAKVNPKSSGQTAVGSGQPIPGPAGAEKK